MLKFMLDTNICIFTLKQRPIEVKRQFECHSGQLCVSAVTAMELIFGAEKSAKPEYNLAIVEGFLARLDVLAYDILAAAHTGQLRAELAQIGKPIGPYDTMIAAHARALGLILVTNNTREFERVPGLRLDDWVR